MKPAPFAYRAPRSLDDALAELAQAGPGAVPLAGGQSLVPQLNSRLRRPSMVVDLNRVPGLDGVDTTPEGGLRVGARTRLETLVHDPVVDRDLPILAETARAVAHPVIRHRATLGGSLCHADPAAELPAMALALEARLTLASVEGTRTVAAADFFTGPFTTALWPGELLIAVEFPPAGDHRHAFAEVPRRGGAGFPLVSLCLGVELADGRVTSARIAAAGVADRPVRLPEAEARLLGRALGDDLGEVLDALAADLDPPTDQHGDGPYRTALLRTLLRRCAARLHREGDPR